MKKYIVYNTITGEKQTVYSEGTMEAKRSVCSCFGWDSTECDVRLITER